jgi:hypothetical protein
LEVREDGMTSMVLNHAVRRPCALLGKRAHDLPGGSFLVTRIGPARRKRKENTYLACFGTWRRRNPRSPRRSGAAVVAVLGSGAAVSAPAALGSGRASLRVVKLNTKYYL